MITRVFHLLNNTVMVYSDKKLLYEGKFEQVIKELKKEVTDSTKFYIQGLVYSINPEFFFDKTYYNFFKSKEGSKCGA